MGLTAVHLLLRNLAGLIWFTLTPLDIDSVKNNDIQYERGSVWFSGWAGVTRSHAPAWELKEYVFLQENRKSTA
jgi:hypothetical protein